MKVASIVQNGQQSFMIINPEGKVVTREEIVKQTGLVLPFDLEQFLFDKECSRTVEANLTKLFFTHEINEFRLLPPIMKTFKIICLAFNYTDQVNWVRFGKNPPKEPIIYMKPRTSLIGPADDIYCPKFVKQLDYEGELAFVIGRKCKNVTQDEALDHIGGYFILNDISARDLQSMDKQYTRAKGFDTFGPCGPWLTTGDEISDPCNLHITTKVNGEIRQDSSTKNLVLKIDEIIHSLSKVMTLEPGDMISTGTPSGTALSLSSHSSKYLKHNDVVEVEIEGLGKIKNRVLFID